MKMKSLILIFIALGCGLVASIGISQVMSNRGGDKKLEMDQILVAKDAIDSGKKLDAAMVQLEDWPKQRIPDGALRKVEEIEGKFSSYRFFKGEPILQAKISDTMGGKAGQIPEGFRVTNIKVDEDTVMEAITPGDTVDVSVFLEQGKNGINKTGVYTILRNVRVFAKGGQTERSVNEQGQETKARTVSLLVKPVQSQELFLAYRLGKISLALRPPSDLTGTKDEHTEDTVTAMSDLISGKATDASGQRGGDSGVGGFNLSSVLGSVAGSSTGDKKGPTMLLINPRGASEYTFPEGGGPAQERQLWGTNQPAPVETKQTAAPGTATSGTTPPGNPVNH